MATITHIHSPLSPISMFSTIEEVRNEDKTFGPLISKQPLARMKSDPSKHRKSSILSLSSIMTTFSNASFSNLGSTFNLASKIYDKTSNKNKSEITKKAAKARENQFLTFNIVGLRDNDSSSNTNEEDNKNNCCDNDTSCTESLNHDSNEENETKHDTIESLVTHLKEIEAAERLRDMSIVTTNIKIEEKTDTNPSNLFGGDDSDSDDSSSSIVAPFNLFGDGDISSDDEDSDSDKNEKLLEKKKGICLKTVETKLTMNNSVKELKDYLKTSEIFNLNKNIILQLFYANILLDDDSRTLGFYGVSNNAFILVAALEGKPLNETNYQTTIENIKLPIVDEKDDSVVVTTNNSSNTNNNNDRLAALRAFTRQHVANVESGNINVASKKNTSDQLRRYNFEEMLDNFEIERMSCLDFLTFEIDDNCVKMPCGHGINEESLLAYALSQVSGMDNDCIRCPQLVKNDKTGKETPCKAVWHYPIVKKILTQCYENNEIKKKDLLNFMKLELLASRNIIQEHFDVQKCGHCHSILFRKQTDLTTKLTDFQGICPMCTNKNRSTYISENNEAILEIESKMKYLKRHKILRTFTKVRKSLEINNIKSKFNNLFIESNDLEEIESNSKQYCKVAHSKRAMKRKRYRRSRKAHSKNVLKVPQSFLNAFRTESDYDSSDEEEEDEKVNFKGKKRGLRPFNPYLEDIDDSDESSEYEYLTTDDDNDSASTTDRSELMDRLFDDCSDDDGINIEHKQNGFVFTNVSDNESDSESEIDAMVQERMNIFKTDSDSESESDNEELVIDNDNNKEDEKKKKKDEVIVAIKSKREIEIECLELKLENLRNRSFDKNKYDLIFCWGCNIAWKDVSSPACGNSDCSTSFRSQILSILRNCDAKQIGSQAKVPSVRACPKCGQLINHWEACKHIQCRSCQTQFCFVCLKKYLKNSGWQCGGYSESCPDGVKQRQSCDSLPSMNVATVTLFEF